MQEAFNDLVRNSESMLLFVSDTVTPDYHTFVEVAEQYGNDAQEIKSFSEKISHMAGTIENVIGEVGSAIQSIAESSEHTVQNGTSITNSIEQVSVVIDNISDMSVKQEKISGELSEVVSNFKLEDNQK